MNILYLTQFFVSNRAGAPLLFYDLARTMARRGHKAHVICNLSTENMNQDAVMIHVVKPKLREANQLPPSMLQNVRYIINCIIHGIRIIREYKIDIIHANSFTPIIAGSLLGRITNVPVVSAVVDVFTGNEFGGWDRWAKINKLPKYYATVGGLLERISLMIHSDVIHTISKTTMHDILELKRDAKIRVIYPGIDISVYSTNRKSEYNDFILFIGRLVFYKNVDILLKAFQHLVPKLPNARLVIVGEGPMKEAWKATALEANISENVTFLGNVSGSEKVDLLNTCSALAQPSLFEGFGLVILEAFAMAKPVLVSDIKPFDEIVDDGLDGFILPKNDPLIWSQKIQYLLSNKSISKKMGEKGFPKINDKFNQEKSMEMMEQLYKEVILNHQ